MGKDLIKSIGKSKNGDSPFLDLPIDDDGYLIVFEKIHLCALELFRS